MDIKAIEETIDEYSKLRSAVKEAAYAKLVEGLKASSQQPEHVARYAMFEGFYVEDGKIVADYAYHGSYSGIEEVTLDPSEIKL
jgi:hypothetical protein